MLDQRGQCRGQPPQVGQGIRNRPAVRPREEDKLLHLDLLRGVRPYDENGVTFIVSDGNKSHTLLDISTLFTQICGRLRDSKYKGEIIHVYSTTKYSRDVTLDEFVAATKKTLQEAVQYTDEINSLSDTARKKRPCRKLNTSTNNM